MDGHGLPKGVPIPSLEKWDERSDDSYRDSVLSAVDQVTEFYEPGRSKPSFDVVAQAKEADGGTVVSGRQPDDFGRPDEPSLRERVQDVLHAYDNSDDMTQKTVVHRVAQVIVEEVSFVHPPENARQWRSVLYRYDADEGIYRPDGKRYAEELCERLLGDFLNNTQASELVGKIKRMSGVRRERLEVEPHRLVVGNGILDLHRGELEPWTPDEHHRTKIDVEYYPYRRVLPRNRRGQGRQNTVSAGRPRPLPRVRRRESGHACRRPERKVRVPRSPRASARRRQRDPPLTTGTIA